MELWELNAYLRAVAETQKRDVSNAILTGYYTAYYLSGGKKSKKPTDLIDKLYSSKQSYLDGLADIARIKELEKKE